MERALTNMEWRLSNHSHLCGDEISIADLAACHELENTRFLNKNLDEYPKVKAWLYKVVDGNPINLKSVLYMRDAAARYVATGELSMPNQELIPKL